MDQLVTKLRTTLHYCLLAVLTTFCPLMSKAATDPVITVQGEITSNTSWTNGNIYLIKGYTYVTSGATLTIQEGTIIKGDKSTKGTLIIEQGAKIIAKGTPAMPIIFTSNQPVGSRNYGDWGGVILCGKAKTNWTGAKDQQGNVITSGMAQVEGGPRSLYGGTDDADNSGIMQYVRIEFGGVAFSPNNEVNGLTLCGVGTATVIDHIQVSFSGDDSYEWFGGTVTAKYLISHRCWDDDFDMDCGYRGKVQFLMGLRDCYAADQSGSKGFEIDAYQTGTSLVLPTKPVISNATICGSVINPANQNCDPQFVSAIHIRKSAEPKFFNSVFMSFPAGLLVNNEGTSDSYKGLGLKVDSVITFKNCTWAGFPTTPFDKTFVYSTNNVRSLTPTTSQGDTLTGTPFKAAGPYTWLRTAGGNKLYANRASLATAQTGLKLTNPFTLNNPSFVPLSGSDLVFNTTANKAIANDTTVLVTPNIPASFSDPNLNDPFFSKVSFTGAFGVDNWATGWTNFDPNNTEYHAVDHSGINIIPFDMNDVKVYPVPSTNEATLSMNLAKDKFLSVTLTDITGKIVSSVEGQTYTQGLNTLNFDLNGLGNGVYFVNINDGNSSFSVKLVVAK